MENLYGLDQSLPAAANFTESTSTEYQTQVSDLLQIEVSGDHHHYHHHHTQVSGSDVYDLIKTQIANHPRYPDLLSAYIDCQKVGAPPEMACLLEEIGRENYAINTCSDLGVDPELDEFMESYCEILHRYKEELSKPFDEATSFLSQIESQLSNLCKGISLTKASGDYHGSAEEEAAKNNSEWMSCGGEVEVSESEEGSGGGWTPWNEEDVKGMLLLKYSGYLRNLKKEFLKKRKKGKLPKDARTTLFNWWNNHYRWPYPTEEEKVKLAEITGLDQKQINNWFINQRKRHWKPSEDMRFSLMEGVSGSLAASTPYFDTTGGPEFGTSGNPI